MAILVADANDRAKIYAVAFAIVQIPCSLFLLAIIVPLYKIAKHRNALYILLSKVKIIGKNGIIYITIYRLA